MIRSIHRIKKMPQYSHKRANCSSVYITINVLEIGKKIRAVVIIDSNWIFLYYLRLAFYVGRLSYFAWTNVWWMSPFSYDPSCIILSFGIIQISYKMLGWLKRLENKNYCKIKPLISIDSEYYHTHAYTRYNFLTYNSITQAV